MLSFNVRSLCDWNRRVSLSNSLKIMDYDILCITQTWLTKDIKDAELF